MFVNDLPLFVKEAYLDLYADDATVHASGKQQKLLNSNYKPVHMILKIGAYQIMFIHIGKTSVMTAGSRQNIGHINMEVLLMEKLSKK